MADDSNVYDPSTDPHARASVRHGKQITVDQKAVKALQLRIAGHPYSRIAEALGYADKSGPYYLVKKQLDQLRKERESLGSQYREILLERLSTLVRSHWMYATGYVAADGAVVPPSPKHALVVLRCIEKEAALLGLEAPPQVNVNVQADVQLGVLVAQLHDISDGALAEIERAARASLEGGDGGPTPTAGSEGEGQPG